jgi:dolichyl-diphosphooligosaccharide--protein glycosyltransferase
MFQIKLLGFFMTALAVAVALLAPRGYFGPLSSRVRGLFVKHTRTGNPLVDSVAEHQATRDEMYFQFFHVICYFAPLGAVSTLWNRSEAKYFVLIYSIVALYFSRKMNRLVLLLSPGASILGGVAVAGLLEWACGETIGVVISTLMKPQEKSKDQITEKEKEAEPNGTKDGKSNPNSKGKETIFQLIIRTQNATVQVKRKRKRKSTPRQPRQPLPVYQLILPL